MVVLDHLLVRDDTWQLIAQPCDVFRVSQPVVVAGDEDYGDVDFLDLN